MSNARHGSAIRNRTNRLLCGNRRVCSWNQKAATGLIFSICIFVFCEIKESIIQSIFIMSALFLLDSLIEF